MPTGNGTLEVVLLAAPLRQRPEAVTVDVEHPEPCRISLPDILDDDEMEALRIRQRCLDLAGLQPKVGTAG